jgi:transcriptional regulator with XRE-family HTH domain
MVGQDFRRWFAEQLRRRGWNQADFVRESGFATGTVSRWINGKQVPRPESVEIAAARALLAAASDRAMRRVLEAVGVAVVAEAGVSIAYRPEVARFVPRPVTAPL